MPGREPMSSSWSPRVVAVLLLCLAGLGALAGLRLVLGGWPSEAVILEQRCLRVSAAGLVGAALALSGVALQTLLRNPLAEPFILGLSSGAALGVMGQRVLFVAAGVSLGAGYVGAVVGAAASAAVVYLASRRHGVLDPLGLLLTGVVLATINGALIVLLNYAFDPSGLVVSIGRWMMGYINEGDLVWSTIAGVGVVTLLAAGVLLGQGRAMDVATFSDAEALSLGVNLALLRTVLFVTASVLAAAAVVLAGPIGFVGLICPQLMRLVLGPAHRPLLVGSALAGAALVILADLASKASDLGLQSGVLPINIFTAIVGGPVFLWLLRPQLGRGTD